MPLASRSRVANPTEPQPADEESAAIADVADNMRAKVYGLCGQLGFDEVADRLGAADRVALLAVREYCSLKSGEVWAEIEQELVLEGVVPTPYDADCLRLALRANECVVQFVREKQQALLAAESARVLEAETAHFDTWRAHSRTVEKAKVDFETFLRRTADFETLKAAKQEQMRKIDESRAMCSVDASTA